jgi:hypothetical protein
VRLCVRLDSPVVYGLNPAYPKINALGFRGGPVTLPKPAGVYRILVLGDSVAYGPGVSRGEAFPQRLQAILAATHPNIEVINTGVPGYSTYNEVEVYRAMGKRLAPDLVVLAFCMNDVVNPRLHWVTAGYPLDAAYQVPAAAIPDLDRDRDHVLPMLRERSRVAASRGVLTRSIIISTLFDAAMYWCGAGESPAAPSGPTPRWPTHLVFEDSISINVLMDDRTPEWRWLTRLISELDAAVRKDDAKLLVLLLPIAYQLDAGYPLLPLRRIAASCEAKNIPCLEMLPEFAGLTKESIFRLDAADYYDIWHLTALGHDVVAQSLAKRLKSDAWCH